MKIIPVIMSGGTGTRLWPISRKSLPKQFHALTSDDTLFVETLKRVKGKLFTPPLIVCNTDHRFLVAEALRQAGVENGNIILEPEVKDTAPALTAAAQFVAKNNPEALILALPCDHNIKDLDAFINGVEVAARAAGEGHLVTFGITPDKPETGYGYIQQGDDLAFEETVFQVARFVEKPDVETAKFYLDDGHYLWNSGMFLYKASIFLSEVEKEKPQMVAQCQRSVDNATQDLTFTKLCEEEFAQIEAISIDYALWEKTEKAVTVPINCGWSDIGNWNSLAEFQEADAKGNVFDGTAIALDSTGNYVKSDGTLMALLGVEDLVVVANEDAVLICHKDKTQDIKRLTETVREQRHSQAVSHTKVYRPWGWYESIESGERHKVKQICVNQGAALSLQKHYHRSEHWIVVSGTATVTNGEKVFDLPENKSTYIPAGVIHRLENRGKLPLKLIEVQTGPYLEEDDIVRIDDVYNR